MGTSLDQKEEERKRLRLLHRDGVEERKEPKNMQELQHRYKKKALTKVPFTLFQQVSYGKEKLNAIHFINDELIVIGRQNQSHPIDVRRISDMECVAALNFDIGYLKCFL